MNDVPAVRYVIASPGGDIEQFALDRPFMLGPRESHPDLTLGDYFTAVYRFVRENSGLLASLTEPAAPFERWREILIRSEKHGAFYHIASVEISAPGVKKKFAVSTAVSRRGREWMKREVGVLRHLHETFSLPYLPRVYLAGEVSPRPGAVPLSMFLGQWFDGYHEWHLSRDKDGGQKIEIWDTVNGHRAASRQEEYEIYRQAAAILTFYYDPVNFHQIHPWHHAAGDFIVRGTGGEVAVRLVTARNYGPAMVVPAGKKIDPLIALTYFFLHLTVGMRLDKYDGVGEAAWADPRCLPAVIDGFFEALRKKEEKGGRFPWPVPELAALFRSFSPRELSGLLAALPALYPADDPADAALIRSRLDEHAGELHAALAAGG